jgi:hypothetical protein
VFAVLWRMLHGGLPGRPVHAKCSPSSTLCMSQGGTVCSLARLRVRLLNARKRQNGSARVDSDAGL